RIEGPTETVVRTEAAVVSGRDLAAAAQKFVEGEIAALEADAEVEAEPQSVPPDVTVPAGRVGVTTSVRFRSDAKTGRGVWVDAIVSVDGERAATVGLPIDVRVMRDVVGANRSVARGEALSADALTIRRADVGGLAGGPVRDLEAALGLAAARPLRAGEVVRAADLFAPPVIRKGDPVTLRVRLG